MPRALILLALVALSCPALPAAADPTASLRATYRDLAPSLRASPFRRPLHLDSREGASMLKGEMYGTVDHPFETVQAALGNPAGWCDILILQFNTKRCEPSAGPPAMLSVNVGRKTDQPLENTVEVELPFRFAAHGPDYFSVLLHTDTGPYGTRHYRILLEAVPIDGGHTFLHLSYSYEFGMTARLAMHAYLATTGRGKVGFTVVGWGDDGTPEYVRGVRGMVERNTMRHFLAIEAHLDTLSFPEEQRVERRLEQWIGAVEHYRRQLHEVEREEYLVMKRREIRRQDG
jgi:hypothetical protein